MQGVYFSHKTKISINKGNTSLTWQLAGDNIVFFFFFSVTINYTGCNRWHPEPVISWTDTGGRQRVKTRGGSPSHTCHCEVNLLRSRRILRTASPCQTCPYSPSKRPFLPCTRGCCTYWFPQSWTAHLTGSLSSYCLFAPCSTSAPRVYRRNKHQSSVSPASIHSQNQQLCTFCAYTLRTEEWQ